MDDPYMSAVEELDLSDMRRFLLTPSPRAAGVIQCYIDRKKKGFKTLYPEYHLYLKFGDQFLLAAKKRKMNKKSNYLISSDRSSLSRDGPGYVGKLGRTSWGPSFASTTKV